MDFIKKNKNVSVILIIIALFFNNKVDAATCTSAEKKELKKEANQIQIIKYFDDTYNPQRDYYYNVNLLNLNEKFYITDSIGNRFQYSEKMKPDSLYGLYLPNKTVTFKIFGAKGKTCGDELIRTVKIKFEPYNDYSKHEACKGIEEFSLCKRNYNKKIESEEWFLEKVNEYKKKQNEKTQEEEKEKNIIEKVLEVFKENPIIIALILIVIIVIIILLVIKKIRNKDKIKINLDIKDKVGDKYEK